MILLRTLIILSAIIVFSFCKNNSSDNNEFDIPDSLLLDSASDIPQQSLQEIVHNISTPVEMSVIVKELDIPFSNSFLLETNIADNCVNMQKKALLLGFYGADLGYINTYGKNSIILDYLVTIKKLSNDLKIGHFFDFNTLKQLSSSNDNIDSLILVSVQSFNNMDEYLHEINKSHYSFLIVTGMWVESMYLITQVIKEKDNEIIRQKIAEEKITLNQLLKTLKLYNKSTYINEIVSHLTLLENVYKNVSIEYIEGETKLIQEDGKKVYVQGGKTVINISDDDLKLIIIKTEKIRKSILNS